MDERYEAAMLFDFYGELLTEKQRGIYQAVMFDDLSLGETAEEYNITRQGVHDMVRRCTKMLEGYEEKLGLVRRFVDLKKKAEEIRSLTDNEKIRRLADEILDEL
ncbi:MAG: YlxM family DNA-binding protein [Lachnospiraceae bacterium]|nr:YlxM family DNA-binding protein [Lachnospiraceae bacterium]